MGGVNVDAGRNVGGLRNAVSLLLETRGVGLGRAHFARRVQAHVVAAMAVIETAARDGASLVRTSREAGEHAARQACHGHMAVAVRQTSQRRRLSFLDARSGEPRDVDVDWRSSLQLTSVRERARPCGYLIGAQQETAALRLRALGIEVHALHKAATRTAWEIEKESEESGPRQDARGAIADDQGIRVLRVRTEAGRATAAPGAFYVPMNQPLASLASAALEPDSQNSFAANRVMDIDKGQLRRVTRLPRPPLPAR